MDAIHTDADTVPVEVKNKVGLEVPANERNTAVDDIATKARELRDRVYEEPTAEITEEVVAEEESKEETLEEESEEGIEREELEEEVEEEVEEELVELNVSGRKQKVARDKVMDAGIRALQKESTADIRLQEATEMQRKAEQMLRDAEERQNQFKPTPPEQDAEDLAELTKKVTTAIYSGDEATAEAALNELVSATRTAPQDNPTQEDINAIVDSRVAEVSAKRELESAQKRFLTSFPEIISDPDLYQLAGIKTVSIQQEHPEWTYDEVLDAAGQAVKSMIQSEPKSAEVDSKSLETKRKAKRKAKPPISADARAPKKPEPKPMTRADVVASMRAGRLES